MDTLESIEALAPPERRTVRIVDRSQWGKGPYPNIVAVTVDWVCPVCGEPRGELQGYAFYEDGDMYSCNTWVNPCGHVDKYDAVLEEARQALLD